MMNSESFIYQPVQAAEPAANTAAAANAAVNVNPEGAGAEAQHYSHHPQQQQQLPVSQRQQQQHLQYYERERSGGGGELLYNNLIPGHYRYGAKPPAPPPGPLSYQQQQQQQQMQIMSNHQYHQQSQQPQTHLHYPSSSSSSSSAYQNIAPLSRVATTTPPSVMPTGVEQQKHPNYSISSTAAAAAPQSGKIMKVTEPDDDDDDLFENYFDDEDLLVVKLNDNDEDDNIHGNSCEDDEQYYRPFRHQITTTTTTTTTTATGKINGSRMTATSSAAINHTNNNGSRSNKTNNKIKNSKGKDDRLKEDEEEDLIYHSPGVDLLALLLLDDDELRGKLGGSRNEDNTCGGRETHANRNHNNDIALLIRDASTKSQRARFLTHALAGKTIPQDSKEEEEGVEFDDEKEGGANNIDNDGEKYIDQLYAAASNAHVEAALSYRRVYQTLFGMLAPSTISTTPAPLEVTDKSNSESRRRKRRSRMTRNGGGIVGVGETRNDEWELAKSMLMLSDMHARTAKSLYGMGLKWNLATTMENRVSIRMDNHSGGVGGGVTSSTENVAAGVDKAGKKNDGGSPFQQASVSNELVAAKAKDDSTSLLPSNSSREGCNEMNGHNVNNSSAAPTTATAVTTSLPPQHERLRMAVRRALDTANHEEDMTNSTFLGGSSSILTTVTKHSTQAINTNKSNGITNRVNKNKVALIAAAGNKAGGMQPQNWPTSDDVKGRENDDGVNAVDELMKLEKELRCMDLALEMGSSIANLSGGGNAVASSSRPEGSFCVVPPGSSYASSSSMWASGIILGGGGTGNAQVQQQQQQLKLHSGAKQQGIAGVRSRANRLQNFLGGGGINNNTSMTQKQLTSPHTLQVLPASTSKSPPQQQHPQETQVNFPIDNLPLDQSWWGGGHGSVLASSTYLSATAKAITDSASYQSVGSNRNANDGHSHAFTRNTSSTTNARQLMQLMDSLNRLGNENAQLMREVEGAKAARAEAKAAKDMMAKFKDDYTQRFSKLKEALKKYNSNTHIMSTSDGNGGIDGDNIVANSSYMKSTTMLEIQKRDQIIKQLSNDLKKERDECKRKDSALQKYEAFYREVKARSAEKARQRQQQLQKEKQHQQKQTLHRP